jgi:hypothetical protein
MAIDNKYGRVTLEKGTIRDDEPVVVFRAKDELLCDLLEAYRLLCERAGSPAAHLTAIQDDADRVKAWQLVNHTQVPQSAGYERRPGGQAEEGQGG